MQKTGAKQHLVPQFLLKQLAVEGKLVVYDKLRKEYRQNQSVANVCHQSRFYDLPGDDVSEEDVNRIDASNTAFESEAYAPALYDMLENRCSLLGCSEPHGVLEIEEPVRRLWAKILYEQSVRTSSYRNHMEDVYKAAVYTGSADLGGVAHRLVVEKEDRPHLHAREIDREETRRDSIQKWCDGVMFFVLNQSTQPFALSDNPVVHNQLKRNRMGFFSGDVGSSPVGYLSRDSFHYLPISPDFIVGFADVDVAAYWGWFESAVKILHSPLHTRDWNQYQLVNCERCIVLPDVDDGWIEYIERFYDIDWGSETDPRRQIVFGTQEISPDGYDPNSPCVPFDIFKQKPY